MNPEPGGLRFKHIPLATANVMHEKFAGFLYWCIYLLFLFLFSEPKVSRRQIVPEDFCVFVDASTAEEQSDIRGSFKKFPDRFHYLNASCRILIEIICGEREIFTL